jgi:hypothetical protein
MRGFMGTEESKRLAAGFPDSVATWYMQSALARLHFIGDRDSRSLSLHALLTRMLECPKDWRIDAIVWIWDDGQRAYSLEQLRFLARSSHKCVADGLSISLNPERVDADLKRLESALASIDWLVDRMIARDVDDAVMSVDDLKAAIDECEVIAKPYVVLLGARGNGSLTSVEQTDWWQIVDSWI